MEKRAKSEQKSTKKRIEKMMKKISVLEAPGGGMPRARYGRADSWDPVIIKNQKTTAHRPQTTEQSHTPLRKARWRIFFPPSDPPLFLLVQA